MLKSTSTKIKYGHTFGSTSTAVLSELNKNEDDMHPWILFIQILTLMKEDWYTRPQIVVHGLPGLIWGAISILFVDKYQIIETMKNMKLPNIHIEWFGTYDELYKYIKLFYYNSKSVILSKCISTVYSIGLSNNSVNVSTTICNFSSGDYSVDIHFDVIKERLSSITSDILTQGSDRLSSSGRLEKYILENSLIYSQVPPIWVRDDCRFIFNARYVSRSTIPTIGLYLINKQERINTKNFRPIQIEKKIQCHTEQYLTMVLENLSRGVFPTKNLVKNYIEGWTLKCKKDTNMLYGLILLEYIKLFKRERDLIEQYKDVPAVLHILAETSPYTDNGIYKQLSKYINTCDDIISDTNRICQLGEKARKILFTNDCTIFDAHEYTNDKISDDTLFNLTMCIHGKVYNPESTTYEELQFAYAFGHDTSDDYMIDRCPQCRANIDNIFSQINRAQRIQNISDGGDIRSPLRLAKDPSSKQLTSEVKMTQFRCLFYEGWYLTPSITFLIEEMRVRYLSGYYYVDDATRVLEVITRKKTDE
tara:strand:- start:4406 stop:6007 length:1602 start_codon:yes stop_codon:yes gene_type:complete